MHLGRSYKYVASSNPSMFYTWKSIKKSNKNNKFKTSAPIRNDKFELPNWSFSVLDIQDYFEYNIKRMKKRLNPLTKMHANKMENRITFRIKKGYYLELLMPKTIKSLKSTEKNDR